MRSEPRRVLLVARREALLLRRSRAGLSAAVLLFALAWLPPLLVAARGGELGFASFEETTPLALALAGALVPLLALLAGAGLFATEIEDRTLVPVLVAPVPRSAFVLGKLLGLLGSLGLLYAAAFGTAAAAVAGARGLAGAGGYLAVVGAGALLGASCLLLGAALGAGGAGRVRAYGAALAAWLTLVFVLDAVLLGIVLATAPPPPESVGHHGHAELSAADSGTEAGGPSVLWLLAGPVDLFRLTAFAAAPEIGMRASGFGEEDPFLMWSVVALAWLLWLGVPAASVHYRFRRAPLG